MSPCPIAPLSVVAAGDLDVAFLEQGSRGGPSAVLLHGFPYSVNSVATSGRRLAAAGWHIVMPFLRGYGPTRFREIATLRSGQQAALGHDLLALIEVLELDRPVVAGYDWGGRAACIVAALWPTHVRGLVTCGGYNIQNIAAATRPIDPIRESRLWYQFYFHGERGRAGLAANRKEIARLLWTQWSPKWSFGDDEFAAAAADFDNPDFVDVVIHSYRHRYGLMAGDPRYAATEAMLAAQPMIAAPTIALDGATSGLFPPSETAVLRRRFGPDFEHRILEGVGHNPPQEAPDAFADAIMCLGDR